MGNHKTRSPSTSRILSRRRRSRTALISALIVLAAFTYCRRSRAGEEPARSPAQPGLPLIDVWYGADQSFGHLGRPQRWVNILGSISRSSNGSVLSYSLNGGASFPLNIGGDSRRLAGAGDFNIEIDEADLRPGANRVLITAAAPNGESVQTPVIVRFQSDRTWPLPYEIDWSRVERIQDAAQVVDGRWRLTPQGVRTEQPFYDRILAIGDRSWTDYQITAEVILHDFSPPRGAPPHYGVTHFGLAARWAGHDRDEFQPHVKWYPLGATAEFRLTRWLWRCSWRIIGDKGRLIESSRRRRIRKNRRYAMKHRVETLDDGSSRYRVKLWRASRPEPSGWDLEWIESRDDLPAGSALLIAHHSDVTFGRIRIDPID